MKKLLGILVLGLLWSSYSFAGVEEVIKEIKKNKDLAQGFNKVKEYVHIHNEMPSTSNYIDRTISKLGIWVSNQTNDFGLTFRFFIINNLF